MSEHTHICTRCGESKSLDEFHKHRVGDVRAGWYCDPCRPERVTEAVRAYRSDPQNRKRDNAASLRWKDANRERNRARDRAYYHRKRNEAA